MNTIHHNTRKNAFTLIEIMMVVSLFLIIIAGTFSVYLTCQKSWYKTSLFMEATQESSIGLARMVYGLGTNGGLREAISVSLNTNAHGHYTSVTSHLPSSEATNHYVHMAYPPDGSWRLTVTNYMGRATCYEYNRKASNVCFSPIIGERTNRIIVANYVTSASATPTIKGVNFSLTVERTYGMNKASVTNSTFIKLRNMPFN